MIGQIAGQKTEASWQATTGYDTMINRAYTFMGVDPSQVSKRGTRLAVENAAPANGVLSPAAVLGVLQELRAGLTLTTAGTNPNALSNLRGAEQSVESIGYLSRLTGQASYDTAAQIEPLMAQGGQLKQYNQLINSGQGATGAKAIIDRYTNLIANAYSKGLDPAELSQTTRYLGPLAQQVNLGPEEMVAMIAQANESGFTQRQTGGTLEKVANLLLSPSSESAFGIRRVLAPQTMMAGLPSALYQSSGNMVPTLDYAQRWIQGQQLAAEGIGLNLEKTIQPTQFEIQNLQQGLSAYNVETQRLNIAHEQSILPAQRAIAARRHRIATGQLAFEQQVLPQEEALAGSQYDISTRRLGFEEGALPIRLAVGQSQFQIASSELQLRSQLLPLRLGLQQNQYQLAQGQLGIESTRLGYESQLMPLRQEYANLGLQFQGNALRRTGENIAFERSYNQAMFGNPLGSPTGLAQAQVFGANVAERGLQASRSALTSGDAIVPLTSSGANYGLKGEEFMAGIGHSQAQLIAGRSRLSSGAAFGENMQYLEKQKSFFEREAKIQAAARGEYLNQNRRSGRGC